MNYIGTRLDQKQNLRSGDYKVSLVYPIVHPACHAGDGFEASFQQDIPSLGTSIARTADDNDFLIFRQFVKPVVQLPQWNQGRPFDVLLIPFVLFAYIQ
jgi:hypothetical protein